jgi:hypothetical protein
MELYVFILAAFVGYQVITRVPPLLHTPLMSATNAISAISLVGSLVLAGASRDPVSNWLGFIAVTAATINVVGVDHRPDLKMFHRGAPENWGHPAAPSRPQRAAGAGAKGHREPQLFCQRSWPPRPSSSWGLKSLAHPTGAAGMQQAALGMALAIVGTLFHHEIVRYDFIAAGLILGTVVGYPLGMFVPMTAMPQRIAISHMFGALAATLVGIAEYHAHGAVVPRPTMAALGFEVLFGRHRHRSLMAFGKLQELITGRGHLPTERGQRLHPPGRRSMFGTDLRRERDRLLRDDRSR